ncbi:MAG: GNAT family N-acetyltransferase [Lapillicoccus sp.]
MPVNDAHVALLPLDAQMISARLGADDFRLVRAVAGEERELHFGPEFPGDAIVLYPRLLEQAGNGAVPGSYVVVDLDTDEVVGQLGTMGPPEGDDVEIGYGINASAWGRGIASQAVGDLLALLDASPGIGRVVARTAVLNPASGRVLEKNRFLVVGREDSPEGELLVWGRPE